MIRINRFLARCGISSRRKAEEYIHAGRVKVNGVKCSDLTLTLDPAKDKVTVDDKAIAPPPKSIYLMLNKPAGYVVSRRDELNRRTIYDLLPDFAQHCVSAGRLDKNSEGLLLITDDGDLINRLIHPKYKIEKVYRCDLDRKLHPSQLEQLRNGIEIEGKRTYPAGVFVKPSSGNGMRLKIVLKEGRKRQIRLMVEAVGAKVTQLRRLQFGILKLDKLPLGAWRMLSPTEIRHLQKSVTDKQDK
ncbi:MAG: rRNA pseudouridine synthase [Candidatus Cloacimonetes bacterium]|nr:rRNA pseudouridine synthase [Candidatus Cloacimonadota bacterium]